MITLKRSGSLLCFILLFCSTAFGQVTTLDKHAGRDYKQYPAPDYGVVGDSATDNTVKLQALIDMVVSLGGGTITFPAGTYVLNDTIILDIGLVSLVGDNVTFDYSALTTGTALSFINTDITYPSGPFPWNQSSRTIRGIRLLGDDKTEATVGIAYTIDVLRTDDPAFAHITIEDVAVTQFGTGMYFTSNAYLINHIGCEIFQNGTGIVTERSGSSQNYGEKLSFFGCTIYANTLQIEQWDAQLFFSNCSFDDPSTNDYQLEINAGYTYFEQCHFEGGVQIMNQVVTHESWVSFVNSSLTQQEDGPAATPFITATRNLVIIGGDIRGVPDSVTTLISVGASAIVSVIGTDIIYGGSNQYTITSTGEMTWMPLEGGVVVRDSINIMMPTTGSTLDYGLNIIGPTTGRLGLVNSSGSLFAPTMKCVASHTTAAGLLIQGQTYADDGSTDPSIVLRAKDPDDNSAIDAGDVLAIRNWGTDVFEIDYQGAVTYGGVQYPTSDGSVGEAMITDGSGNADWGSVSSAADSTWENAYRGVDGEPDSAFVTLDYANSLSGTGQTNTASNAGGGFKLSETKVGSDLPFKTMTAEKGVAYDTLTANLLNILVDTTWLRANWTRVGTDYLPLAGGTMGGDIDMDGNNLYGVDSADITNYTDGSIGEPDLDFSNLPFENYIASYNAAGSNFTWVAPGGTFDSIGIDNASDDEPEYWLGPTAVFRAKGGGVVMAVLGDTVTVTASLGTSIVTGEITDGTILEEDLNVTNSPTDNYLLSANTAGGNFTWVAPGAGGGGLDSSEVSTIVRDSVLNYENAFEAILDLQDLQGAVTDGQVPNGITIDLATLATTVTVSDDESTADAHEVVFTTDNTNLESDGTFNYNPSTGTVTATIFSGTATDVAADAVLLNEIGDPDANSVIGMGAYGLTMNFGNPSSNAFELNATGAFTGHLLHVHQSSGNPGATHLVHIESADPDVVPLCALTGQDTVMMFGGQGGPTINSWIDSLGIYHGDLDADTIDISGDKIIDFSGGGLKIVSNVQMVDTANAVADAEPKPVSGNAVFDYVTTRLDDSITTAWDHSQNNSQAHTDYVLNTGDIISGNITLDDGAGNSPTLIFTDGDNETLSIEKQDAGAATISNSEGAIRIQPSGDINDYLYVTTTTGVVTLTTQAGDDGDLVISSGGGDISFSDDNLSGTGAVDFGGATSFEIPNGTNPTTDAVGEIAMDSDDPIMKTYSVYASGPVAISLHGSFQGTLYNPAVMSDSIPVYDVGEIQWPGGIEIDSVQVTISDTATYNLTLFTYSNADPPVFGEFIDTIAITNKKQNSVTFYDGTIEVGKTIYIGVPTTDVDWLKYSVFFHGLGND